jgi:hypothetical protein
MMRITFYFATHKTKHPSIFYYARMFINDNGLLASITLLYAIFEHAPCH